MTILIFLGIWFAVSVAVGLLVAPWFARNLHTGEGR